MNKIIDAKIFFLTPGSEYINRIEAILYREKCEVYILKDQSIVIPLFEQFDKNILVIDLDNNRISGNLDEYIFLVINSCREKLIKIIVVGDGVRHIQDDLVLYLKRSDLEKDESIFSLIGELNIWGQRNFIRFGSNLSRIAFFRMKSKESWRTGVIHDISASGMSCSFDKHSEIKLDESSTSIEICIKEKIFYLTGSFLIRRTFKNANMFVIVFSRKRNPSNIAALNSIIYKLSREDVLEKIRKLV